MPYKVRRVLLVASLYDAFMLEEDGRLPDLLGRAYKQRDLGYVPTLTRVAGGQAALNALQSAEFELVVSIMRLGDMDPFTFGRKVKDIRPGLPVVILAYNTPELQRLMEADDRSAVERIFVWQGDGKILTGIIQYIEDLKNAEHDTRLAGVQNLLIVEDSIQFYSAYLPLLFDELWDQTDRILQEGLTYTQRALRQKARPKVHLATDFEEASRVYHQFKGHLLGVITDVRFPRDGRPDPEAGLDLARMIRGEYPHLPILIQSSEPGTDDPARLLDVEFVAKSSKTLVNELRENLLRFGFGDLVFLDTGQHEVGRVTSPAALAATIDHLPDDVLLESMRRGDIQRWLLARTEFELAKALDSPPIAGTQDPPALRSLIRQALADSRQKSREGSIVPYSRAFHEEQVRFSRMGGGSIGGKARGLAFINRVLAANLREDEFPGVALAIPRTLVLGTDVFDAFIRDNHLLDFAANETSDRRIASTFIQADFPVTLVGDLRSFIRQVKVPLAVRSSSLLEDALYQPFAGIYATKMLPNRHFDDDSRFRELAAAVKLVFASTYFRTAKAYIESTNHRIEEEKMAVIIQEVVGQQHGDRFYPHFSGVACSYNYYPVSYAKPQDGVANLAIGLGKTVVDGGFCLRFTPAFPRVLPQFGTVTDMLDNSQREFYAITMKETFSKALDDEDEYLLKLPVSVTERDGTLTWIGSTYNRENDRVYDGISSPGPRIVNFAHILKNEVFPLSKILQKLLRMAEDAMGCPVEMEFAVTLGSREALPARFGFLQVRPLVVSDELVQVNLAEHSAGAAIGYSDKVLGNGVIKTVADIVFVKPGTFDAAKSPLIARQVDQLNARLRSERRPYLLAGPGRWGSSDPWLGIPVNWGQINGVKVMVEVSLPNMNVDPSQGSHFFQNMTSLRIGYFTISHEGRDTFLDWPWLESQPVAEETEFLKHLRFDTPIEVQIDGRNGHGVILKPGNKEDSK